MYILTFGSTVFIHRAHCHPAALVYRNNFNAKRDELAALLMILYNEQIFDGKLEVAIKWSETLNTAGLCVNRRRFVDDIFFFCFQISSTLIYINRHIERASEAPL